MASRFEQVVGVDIAPAMLDLARRDNPVAARCEFLLNPRSDLALFGDGEFDLVYSSVVLQHLPPRLIRGYLAEFARVLRPGGSLIVQLPTRPRPTLRGLAYRCLPAAVLGLVQRGLLGYPAPCGCTAWPPAGSSACWPRTASRWSRPTRRPTTRTGMSSPLLCSP